MRLTKVSAIAINGLALLVVLGTTYRAMPQDVATPYPKMAPIGQYLMDRTLGIYGHVLGDDQRDAMGEIESVLSRP